MRTFFLLATGLTLAACAPKAETPEQAQARLATESASAQKAIDSLNTDFVGHFNAGHADLVAAQYAEDGELMLGGSPVAKGRAAIAAAVSGLAPMKPSLKLTLVSVAANGPMAIERGTYDMTIQPPGASGPMTESGNFIVHWHQVDGKWLRVHDITASPSPFPPPPPPAPAKK